MGGFRDVLAEAKAVGIDAVLARRSLDDLAALATAARLSGENEIARRALSAQRSRFPGTAAAAEAAFLLGRLAEDVDRNPAAAAAWYDRCLEEAPVGDLAAEALGRQLGLVATSATRTRAPVRSAARRYLDRFPDGPHAARARALLDAPDPK
jgi:TolA-binding protein